MLRGQHVEGRHGTVSQRRAGQQREAAAQLSGRQLQAAKIHAFSHRTAQAARHHRNPHPRPTRAAQRLRQRAVCQNHPFVHLRQRRVSDQQGRGLRHRAHQTLAAPHLPETAQRARQGAGLPPGGSGAVSGGSMGMEGRRQEVFPQHAARERQGDHPQDHRQPGAGGHLLRRHCELRRGLVAAARCGAGRRRSGRHAGGQGHHRRAGGARIPAHSPGWKARGHPPQMRQADRGRRGRPARIDAAGPRAAADGSAGGRGARHRAGQPAFAAGTAGPVKRH